MAAPFHAQILDRGVSRGVDRRLNNIRYRMKCQVRLFLYGSLLRISGFFRYSATAAVVVTQLRPIFLAESLPFSAKCRRWPELIPDRAAASLSEINRSSSNGPWPAFSAQAIISSRIQPCRVSV